MRCGTDIALMCIVPAKQYDYRQRRNEADYG